MLKQYFGLITTVVLILSPTLAFAGKVQVNSQKNPHNDNSAAVKEYEPPSDEKVKCYFQYYEDGRWKTDYYVMSLSLCKDYIDYDWSSYYDWEYL